MLNSYTTFRREFPANVSAGGAAPGLLVLYGRGRALSDRKVWGTVVAVKFAPVDDPRVTVLWVDCVTGTASCSDRLWSSLMIQCDVL